MAEPQQSPAYQRLLEGLLQAQNVWDVLLLCYELASRDVHRFFNESMLPPRAQPGPRKAEWRAWADELLVILQSLRNPWPPDLAFDDDARLALHEMLAESEPPITLSDEVTVVAALAEAITQFAPSYEVLRHTEWAEGRPLNLAFLDRYEVHPVRLSSPLRTLLFLAGESATDTGVNRPLLPVTPRAQRGLYPDGLFPGYVFVPVAGSRYQLDMRATDWSNRWIQSSRRPRQAESLTIRASCVAGLRETGVCGQGMMGSTAIPWIEWLSSEDQIARRDGVQSRDSGFVVRESPPEAQPDLGRLVNRLCAPDVDILVFPEMMVTSHGLNAVRGALASISSDEATAVATPMLVVAGSRHLPQADGRPINRALVLDGAGQDLWSFDKLTPAYLSSRRPDKHGSWGHEWIQVSNTVVVRDLPLGRIAVVICADLDQPDLCTYLAGLGVELVLAPTMNPGRQSTSLFVSTFGDLARQSHSVIVSVNTCSVHRLFDGRDSTQPRDLSFAYVPLGSSTRSVDWGHCQCDPAGCLWEWRLSANGVEGHHPMPRKTQAEVKRSG